MTSPSPRTKATAARKPRPGRPPKYGQSASVVAVTLPHDVIAALRRLHRDLGWAIVTLVARTTRPRTTTPAPEVELVEIGGGKSLIVVNSELMRTLPTVQLVPLSDQQAFLALEAGRGLGDLEVAVVDRLATLGPGTKEYQSTRRVVEQLRRWRRDRRVTFESRGILLASKKRRRRQ